ncbi:MAG: 50S ribosomal protein L1 [Promethearchaeota archaeon]
MAGFDQKSVQAAIQAAIEASVIKKEGKPDKVRKFVESLDFVVNVRDVNLNDPKNRIQAEIQVPNVVDENASILVICDGDRKLQARKLGFDTLDKEGLQELGSKDKKQIKKFVKKYRFFIAQADLMRFVAQYLGRYLGPRGRMPIPAPNGFGVFQPSQDVTGVLERYKSVVRLMMRKQPQVQVKIGKKNMSVPALTQNAMAVLDYLSHHLPRGLDSVKSVYIKTTMGRGIRVQAKTKGGRK